MNYYFEYLTQEDRKLGAYEKYASEISNLPNRLCCNSRNELTQNINKIQSNTESHIITIFSHGYLGEFKNEVICGLILGNSYANFISWADLIQIVNLCRTKFKITLNLITPCNSYKILDSITDKVKIDIIWYSNLESPTIRYSILLAEEFKDFNIFLEEVLSDEEISSYGEYKKSKN
jgi:hypothetical protein